jgi:ubiquinone/menaquinone biosynthesis C-methylase UbiE
MYENKTVKEYNRLLQYQKQRKLHWNNIYTRGPERKWGNYYHKLINKIYSTLISPGLEVLEIGCGHGDLLAAVKPSYGVGVDFSEEIIKQASQKYPQYNFISVDAHELELDKTFDVIILSDLVNDLFDVQSVFECILPLTKPNTRIIINFYSKLWEIPLKTVRFLGLSNPMLEQNWLTTEDVTNLLQLTSFEIIKHWPEIIWPLSTPFFANVLNRYIAKIWPFKYFALANFIVARPTTPPEKLNPSVSIIVPARNEAGNIAKIIERTPKMGSMTEIIFVEGHSTDDTLNTIKSVVRNYPQRNIKVFQQTGKGKGDAVRLGFSEAQGEILMILDADMTVPPENLPRFFEAIKSGTGEFINGVRLIYPMDIEAMRYLNLLGNKFFSLAFSWLLGQPIKDTLCGTKVLRKKDYEKIVNNRSYFGDFDPFGDFDLLFGAAKLNLRIVEIPIRYAQRTYGSTNIDRWKHGWLLLRMVIFAAKKIKFV